MFLLKKIKVLSAIPNSFKAAAMLIAISALSFKYYYYPTAQYINHTAWANNSAISVNAEATNGATSEELIKNSVSGKKNLPIYCVEPNAVNDQGLPRKLASLSFDAAWGDEDTIQILDILDKYNVKVTFFMTGGWVESYPDMVKEIDSRGHDLGNHSERHKNMSQLSISEQTSELMIVHDKVKTITGKDMFLFRPPYGDYDNTVVKTAYTCGYYPIQWNVDSLDWKDYGIDNIINTVINHKALSNGSIILMHNGAKFTAQALEQVISGLIQQGYELIPISQLIYRNNFHMDATGKQLSN